MARRLLDPTTTIRSWRPPTSVSLQAAGEHLRMVVTVNGHDVELDLAALVR
jgi:hypothetical protein